MNDYDNFLERLEETFRGSYETAGGAEFRYFHGVNVAKICSFKMVLL